jgi:selenocysteine lyase/cysteine desulfurase
VYLNTGSEGLVARPVEEKVLALTRLYDEEGFNTRHVLEAAVESARTKLASWLNVSADDIAFTDNASHSVAIVAAGLEWKAGDEVLMSEEEHPALLLNFYYLVERFGVKVKRFALSPDGETQRGILEREITSRTKLIATSHVAALTGLRIPAAAIAALGRERGILTLIDGAQAVGEIVVDVSAIGCDFYVSNGHKWIHGPKGTGILVVRKDALDKVRPLQLGTGAAAYPLPDGTRIVLNETARRYEYATRHLGSFGGLLYALEWLEGIGLDRMIAHAEELTDYTKDRVRALPGARLRTPDRWEESSAMVGFSIDDVDGVALREWMRWERNILARRVLEFMGLRVAVAYFTTRAEIDLFFDTIPQWPKWPHAR